MAQAQAEILKSYPAGAVALIEPEEELPDWVEGPDPDKLIPPEDEPVDNLFSETQQRLLTEPLYSSWIEPGKENTFLAAANIAVYHLAAGPSIGPDVMLACNITVPAEFWSQQQPCYLIWDYGKAPDLVIEIISKTVRGEDSEKKAIYERMGVSYYVIFDPNGFLMDEPLTVYHRNGAGLERQSSRVFPKLGLGLTFWEGEFEGKFDRWLRWTDANGQLIATGKERANSERDRADGERDRADGERDRADGERDRADGERDRAEQSELLLQEERARSARLAELLRQLGQDPEALR